MWQVKSSSVWYSNQGTFASPGNCQSMQGYVMVKELREFSVSECEYRECNAKKLYFVHGRRGINLISIKLVVQTKLLGTYLTL